MEIELIHYPDILIKDLPSIKYLLSIADETEFIDHGRANTEQYESKLYIKLADKYVGFISPRKMADEEVELFSKHLDYDLTGGWRITPIFILGDYQGIGIGRNVLNLFYKDKKEVYRICLTSNG